MCWGRWDSAGGASAAVGKRGWRVGDERLYRWTWVFAQGLWVIGCSGARDIQLENESKTKLSCYGSRWGYW